MRGLLSLIGIVVGVVVLTASSGPEAAPRASIDEDAVRAAVLDYVEGVYDVQPERIARSVHPSLRKIGYIQGPDGSWSQAPMTFEQLHRLSAMFNADGHLSADAPKEITVLDVLDQTASAKLVADWGVDYFHLAKVDGRWQILNVMWQTPPQVD